ncbi:MAG: acyl-homoserine-lactone acylase [Flaviaesturariibacter sp.]|nr:acyl-homoserine-lactone acylase [Flaviaesturariibacter sp.]
MRVLPFILSTVITVALVYSLDHKWGAIPPLGKFLSPQQGFWQNAEPADEDYNQQLTLNGLKGKATVYLDDRLVPHIFAEQEADAYFIQGYLHAKFRLWQMEFQTFAGAGRLSEKLGNDPRIVRYDREQRRQGMVYGAENTAREMEKDPVSKSYFDAYSAGVNSYISSLSESALPVEYKLLDYKPEPWSNFKIALFLKVMSKDLAGYERDLEFTNAKSVFSLSDMAQLYPEVSDSLIPIVPKGTAFAPPGIVPLKPASADSLYFGNDTTLRTVEVNKPERTNGSNNWALSGSKTASGAPILCNDPHLTLSLPSIWYEMQITTPTMNAYGATFPGSPSVIIGFNDSIAFGFTNAMRDVKDYYTVRFKDASKKEYWFEGNWKPTKIKVEEVKIKGSPTLYDTVAYTHWGPVMYDESFTNDVTGNKAIAVRWTAHDPSNEGAAWFKLDRAKNYTDYLAAIKGFVCPGQNMLFASKSGDIAVWQQAKFPARWQGQGSYIMPGEDNSYAWQGFIPESENPHVLNPADGFIQSANQRPVDETYPYFIPGNYIVPRGVTIYNQLKSMQAATPQMMMALQNNYYSNLAADAVPLMLKYLDSSALNDKSKDYLTELRSWNFYATPESRATTIYQAWMDSLKTQVWSDEFARIQQPKVLPDEETLIELLLRDSASHFIDNINTPSIETLQQQVTTAFTAAAKGLEVEERTNELIWWKHKEPTIYHLLRTSLMPFAFEGIKAGGWGNTPNAITKSHGPSWRMIVQLTRETEAYGIYPGGQSGNPGSRFYNNFINDWTVGKYYKLWVMKPSEAKDKRVIGTLTFNPA